jgi:hypothetical protein
MSGNGFKDKGRIIIVGASLAGLRAAEALREEGFRGRLTIIGDEPDEPYDRPPLSKQVLAGWVRADHTKLPRLRAVDAEWRLGVPRPNSTGRTGWCAWLMAASSRVTGCSSRLGCGRGNGPTPMRPLWRVSIRCGRVGTRRGCRPRWPLSRSGC